MPSTLLEEAEDGSIVGQMELDEWQVALTKTDRVEIYSLSLAVSTVIAENFKMFLTLGNGLIEDTFVDFRSPHSWAEQEKKYTEAINNFYSSARALTAHAIANEIKKYIPKSALLISLGCREGDDIKACIQAVKEQKIPTVLSGVGIDICSESITKANASIKNLKDINLRFVNNDCNTFENLLTVTEKAKTMKIGLAVGFLTRNVLSGTYEALKVFQKAFRTLDAMFITGLTAPLITVDIAKAIGWSPTLRNFSLPKHEQFFAFYELRKSAVISLLDRLHENNTLLDLSMSAVPLEHLKLFIKNHPDKIDRIDKIDFSFAYFLPEELKQVPEILTLFKNLSIITHDPDDSWVSLLQENTSQRESKERTEERYKFVCLYKRTLPSHELPFYNYETFKALEKVTLTKEVLYDISKTCIARETYSSTPHENENEKGTELQFGLFKPKSILVKDTLETSYIKQSHQP